MAEKAMTKHPSNEDKMSMSAFDMTVRSNLVRLEEIRASRLQTNRVNARKSVARETKVLPGTLENICRDRIKGVRGWIGKTIEDALLRELEREMRRLQHEYQMVLQRGVDPREDEVAEIASDLAKVRASLDSVR